VRIAAFSPGADVQARRSAPQKRSHAWDHDIDPAAGLMVTVSGTGFFNS
jgi:hypothetical protein